MSCLVGAPLSDMLMLQQSMVGGNDDRADEPGRGGGTDALNSPPGERPGVGLRSSTRLRFRLRLSQVRMTRPEGPGLAHRCPLTARDSLLP